MAAAFAACQQQKSYFCCESRSPAIGVEKSTLTAVVAENKMRDDNHRCWLVSTNGCLHILMVRFTMQCNVMFMHLLLFNAQ